MVTDSALLRWYCVRTRDVRLNENPLKKFAVSQEHTTVFKSTSSFRLNINRTLF